LEKKGLLVFSFDFPLYSPKDITQLLIKVKHVVLPDKVLLLTLPKQQIKKQKKGGSMTFTA